MKVMMSVSDCEKKRYVIYYILFFIFFFRQLKTSHIVWKRQDTFFPCIFLERPNDLHDIRHTNIHNGKNVVGDTGQLNIRGLCMLDS